MQFCEVCENMLYVKTNADKCLVKYCKHCNFEKVEVVSNGCIKITETIYTEDDLLYCQNINKYLRHDPTLRRINDSQIVCPMEDCETNTQGTPQQVLYVKYHPKNMKYFYVCDHCGHIWR